MPKSQFQRSAAALLYLGTAGVWGSACDPSPFVLPATQGSSRDRDGGTRTGSNERSMQAGGRGGADSSAARGGASAPSSGGAAARDAASDEGDAAQPGKSGSGGSTEPAGGAGGAPAGGSGGHAQPAAGSDGQHECARPDLDAPRATKLSDRVLEVPDPSIEIGTGPAVQVGDRMLMLVPTQRDGALVGRAIGAWAAPSDLTSEHPRVGALTTALLPDEPVDNDRTSLPTSVWLAPAQDSVQFVFSRLYILSSLSVELAQSTLPKAAPAQVLSAADGLFPHPPAADGGMDQHYRPTEMFGGVRDGDRLYFYVHNMQPDPQAGDSVQPCWLARVPQTHAQDGASYEFWSDGHWVADLGQATPVIDHVPSSLSVLYNNYLQKYLAVRSGANNDIHLAWADALQGPFHEFDEPIATVPAVGGSLPLSYGANELPVPHSDCDPEIVVWYSVPLEQTVADGKVRVRIETHVMRLSLR